MAILITRPEAASQATSQRLQALGFEVEVEPMLKIVSLAQLNFSFSYSALIFTSQNAVNSLNLLKPSWQQNFAGLVFVVGEQTAQTITHIDKDKLFIAQGDADNLIKLVAEKLSPSEELLYLCGDHISIDVEHILKSKGYSVTSQVIYKAVAAKELSHGISSKLIGGKITYAPFYSVRSATTFINLAEKSGLTQLNSTIAVALSENIAQALGEISWKEIRVAKEKSETALIEQLN